MNKKTILMTGITTLLAVSCLAGCQKAPERPQPVTPSSEKKTENSKKPLLPRKKKRTYQDKQSQQRFNQPNPTERIGTLDAINQYAEGKIVFPKQLAGGYTFNTGWKLAGKNGKNIYQLIYHKNKKVVALRFSPNVEDPQLSGDQRRHRWKKNTIIAGKEVAIAGERGRVYKCLWRDKNLNLSLTSKIAMAPDEAKSIIQAV